MAFDNVARGDELEATWNIRDDTAARKTLEHPSHPRRLEIIRAQNGAGDGNHHLQSVYAGLQAFMLDRGLGEGIGQVRLQRVEGLALVGRPIGAVPGGAERAGDDDAFDASLLRRAQQVASR